MFLQTLFVKKENLRDKTKLRFILCLSFGLVISFLLAIYKFFSVPITINFILYTIDLITAISTIFVLFKVKLLQGLMSSFCSAFMISIIRLINKLLFFSLKGVVNDVSYTILSNISLYAIIFLMILIIYFITKKNPITFDLIKPWQAIIFIVSGSSMMLLTLFEDDLKAISTNTYIFFIIMEIMCGLLILLMIFSFILQVRDQIKKLASEHMLNESKKQYDKLLENINTINIKAHDLKHFAAVGSKQSKDLYELASNYDSFIHTGNMSLDVVLTEKSLQCNVNGISFSCVVDGKLLNFMDREDIISLFSNALDNAIEYEKKIDKDDAFIDIKVIDIDEFISIHIENCFKGTLKNVDGLPKTSKGDELFHGFGMKSMRSVAEKYSGNMSYKVEDDMFQVDVLIPIKK